MNTHKDISKKQKVTLQSSTVEALVVENDASLRVTLSCSSTLQNQYLFKFKVQGFVCFKT